jgi:hypothetical protein
LFLLTLQAPLPGASARALAQPGDEEEGEQDGGMRMLIGHGTPARYSIALVRPTGAATMSTSLSGMLAGERITICFL